MAQKEGGKSGFALLFGLIAGAVGGLLFSPRSGKENRALIKEKATELKDTAEAKKQEVIDKAGEVRSNVEDEVNDRSKTVRSAVEDKLKDVEKRINGKIDEVEGKAKKTVKKASK